jgi:hypothetical protein
MKLSSLASLALAVALVSCGKQETTQVESSRQPSVPQGVDSPEVPPASETASKPQTPQTPSPLSNEDSAQLEAWWKKYNLDPNDPAQLVADSDGDGYSNREEFLADTNPRDPNSLPGVMEGVAMKTLNEVTVPMVLREVKGGKARIQHSDGTEETLVAGATPKGSALKVKAVRNEVKADKHGVWTDMSQVMLENPETKETVFLMRDLPARSSQTHAVIAGTDGSEQKVHFDETFTIASHPGKQFKVIDLRADQVVVQEVGGKAVFTIPKR